MAVHWQPNTEVLNEICYCIESQAHDSFQQIVDLNNYLAFIFARAEDKSPTIREAAGLCLKDNLKSKSTYESMVVENQEYIKSELLYCIQVGDRKIKPSVGTTISVLTQLLGFSQWPELLQALQNCLNSATTSNMEFALEILVKICDDKPHVLSPESFIHLCRPLFLILDSEDVVLKEQSRRLVNQYIKLVLAGSDDTVDEYVRVLLGLASDSHQNVRIFVCEAFMQLIKDLKRSRLMRYLCGVIECVIQLSNDCDQSVAIRACQFWMVYWRANCSLESMVAFLPQIIPVLVKNLCYCDEEESLVQEPADCSTLRLCSIDALEFLSIPIFEKDTSRILMPIIQLKLSGAVTIPWKEKEAAVLAFGTVVDNLFELIYPVLPEIVDSLVELLDTAHHSLIRSTSCWALSRSTRFILKEIGCQEGQERFKNVLIGLLKRMSDNNARVQKSACSAFLILEEMVLWSAKEELVPFVGIILQHILIAFANDQSQNFTSFYYIIEILLDAVGEELHKSDHLDVLMPPVISKWKQLLESNGDACLLMKSLRLIAQKLGGKFSQFSEPIFHCCISSIRTRQLGKARSRVEALDLVFKCQRKDKDEIVICSLDILCLLDCLQRSSWVEQVVRSSLSELVLQCCKYNDSAKIRESAFILLHHMAMIYPFYIQPQLDEVFEIASKQLNGKQRREHRSVAICACRAVGQLAIMGKSLNGSKTVIMLLRSLIDILKDAEEISLKQSELRDCSAIALGRLLLVYSEYALYVQQFIKPLCKALSKLENSKMKEDAFRGLYRVVDMHPFLIDSSSLVFIFESVASLQVITNDYMHITIYLMLQSCKKAACDDAEWEKCMSSLEEQLKVKVSSGPAI